MLTKITQGYVYCISNPFYKNIVKIGYSKHFSTRRMNELYTTGVPAPFTLEAYLKTSEYKKIESLIHKDLCIYRVNRHREFFMVPVSVVQKVFSKYKIQK